MVQKQSQGRTEKETSKWVLTRKCATALIDLLTWILADLQRWFNPGNDSDNEPTYHECKTDPGLVEQVVVKGEHPRAYPRPSGKYYAVARGCRPGIYQTWMETVEQVHHFGNVVYQRFDNLEDAEIFMTGHYDPVLATTKIL
jgi:hypothetical protein